MMMVSDDIPLESTPLSTVTSGVTPPGITVDSHCDITAGTFVTSRLDCWRRLDVFDGRFGSHGVPSA